MVLVSLPERIKPTFSRYIGIDYSGAETPDSSLKGLRVYEARSESLPVEVAPPPSPRKYWTRRGLAAWLAEVYPSLWSRRFPREGRTADQHDAYAAASWLRQADTDGRLGRFLKPAMLPGEYHVARIEGWILGLM
jgi:hypothetical protein